MVVLYIKRLRDRVKEGVIIYHREVLTVITRISGGRNVRHSYKRRPYGIVFCQPVPVQAQIDNKHLGVTVCLCHFRSSALTIQSMCNRVVVSANRWICKCGKCNVFCTLVATLCCSPCHTFWSICNVYLVHCLDNLPLL